jgi:hypothetical protein
MNVQSKKKYISINIFRPVFSVIPGNLGSSPEGVKRIATPILTRRAMWSFVARFTLWSTYHREEQTSKQLTGGMVDLRAGLDAVEK